MSSHRQADRAKQGAHSAGKGIEWDGPKERLDALAERETGRAFEVPSSSKKIKSPHSARRVIFGR